MPPGSPSSPIPAPARSRWPGGERPERQASPSSATSRCRPRSARRGSASRHRAATRAKVLIETPYRNVALLEALLANLQPTTTLSVSVGLTLPGGFTRSASVAQWRQRPKALPADVPAVFALLAGR
jgi:16S rRNA (cytidine1402-2'-O)-methyltransferase